MNIVHIGLVSHYTERMNYQDNILSEFNKKDGHNVTFISDIFYYQNGQLIEGTECDCVLDNGVRLIRLKYDFIICSFVTKKIQKVSRLNKILEELQPDSILYHGACGYEMIDVAKYVSEHPTVLFYVDSHEDFHNTARTFTSKIAYKYIHGYFLKKALNRIEKILYISEETKDYLQDMYNISEGKLEFFPLGGVISSEEKQRVAREKIIKEYNLSKDCVICAHSGKLSKEKRTLDLIEAMEKTDNKNLVLFIIGSVPDEMKKILLDKIEKNKNIRYLGWKSGRELLAFLDGTDLYCQPGSQSATMQNALCCGCAVMVAEAKSHRALLKEAAFYVESINDMRQIFDLLFDKAILEKKKKEGYELAKEKLDYYVLARRIISKE